MKKQQAPMQAQLRKYLYQKAAHNKVPLSGTFELTPEESIQQKNGLRWEKPVQKRECSSCC